uniref:RxLR effector candidate protein n=1 Tax=Hyaloperonospora arabidopsidis (strain Emoy2) TaxID=559515 RepID=M4BZ37_HYAAE
MANPEQRLHYKLVDTAQSKYVSKGERNYRRQRQGILANRPAATPGGHKAGVSTGRHEYSRSASAIMSQTSSQATKRAITSGEEPRQPPDSSETPALLTRLKIYQTSCNHK